jgi:type IV pilus assembly protein PilB
MAGTQGFHFQGTEIIARYEKELVSEGLVTADKLSIAKISQENLGLDLGSVLVKKGFVTEEALLAFVAKQLKIPFVSLKDFKLNAEIIHRIPLHIARQHVVIPIKKDGKKISVAMANPFDSFARDDLKDYLRAEIEPCLVSAHEISEALDRYYEGNLEEEESIPVVEVTSEADVQTESATRKMQEMALGPKVVSAVNNMLARASAERASDIHIEPVRSNVRVRFRIDGLLRDRGSMVKSMQLPVISRIKILAGLDIAERRVPQDGRVRILLVGKPLDLRISTCPTQHGEKVVIRLLAKENVRSVEALGFNDAERRVFSDIITKSHGIFLITGPTGSGKSTTLYAALMRINSSEKNIISVEDPIENEIDGVNQVAVNTKTGLTFAAVLRSVLRQDPDVIMLGEIRDRETAEISVRAAITGHMVLSTLHTNTAAGAISRLNDLGIENFLLSSALKGVMAQRLVRKICQKCREEVDPDPAKMALLKADLNKVFHGKGCKACQHTGYSGRCGIFELAAIDDAIRTLIYENATESQIVKAMRNAGVKSIVQDGVEKIAAGITTVDEVLRVTQED